MDQQHIRGPGELQRRCMSVIIDQLNRNGRTNSMNELPLPAPIVRQMEEIHQWKLEISLLLDLIHLTPDLFARLPNTSPFSGHFRWTNENGMVKIDRRATALAQLDNFDPSTTTSKELIELGFVLAAMYCLENHVRRLLPHRRPDFVSLNDGIPAVAYWSENQATDYLYYIYSNMPAGICYLQQWCCSDFWLAVIRSFWPIAKQQLSAIGFQHCTNYILRHAMDNGHKSVIDYVWAQYTTDAMRKSLVIADGDTHNRNGMFLCAAFHSNEKEILFDFLTRFDDPDARRAAISSTIDEICTNFEIGHNSEMIEHMLDCMIADCATIPADIARPLCKFLSIIWDRVLSPGKRAQISNQFVDLLRYAVDFGYVELATRIWNEEQSQVRKFEILYYDEYAAFRSSCANGRLELVQLFWEWASTEQRCRIIGCKFGDALTTAARSGHLAIVRYIWENMDPRVAYEAIDSQGIDDASLSQLIIASSDGGSPPHELVRFLSMLVSTPSDGRDSIYPTAVMKRILASALTLDDGRALHVLVQRAKHGGDDDRLMLRSLIGVFEDEQRVRMRSKLATDDDIKVCGLESMEIAARLEAMPIQPVREEDDGEDEEDEEEPGNGEEFDLTDEYYSGF